MLRIENLEAGYGRIQVLRGVSLVIERREIVTLIGANGAGKSTLMKVICGVVPLTGGGIEFQGADIGSISAAARVKLGLVLVPEGRRVLGRMTVHENLQMGAYARSNQATLGEEIEEIFRLFPILSQRRRLPADVLSGGEQQMLAIGRAILARPRLLMLDEPSLGLSPLLVAEIFSIVAKLHQTGITILLVEQNARKALKVADRGYVMETGRVVLYGTSQELLQSAALHAAYLGAAPGKRTFPPSSR
jgi:branched-chain amino acid transport system ATP-binding protein